MARRTKTADVLRHLQLHGSITGKEAWDLYGLERLSAVIYNLRHKGHDIETDRVSYTDRNGNKGAYGRYYYRGEQDGEEA